jgi:hypothetical protein
MGVIPTPLGSGGHNSGSGSTKATSAARTKRVIPYPLWFPPGVPSHSRRARNDNRGRIHLAVPEKNAGGGGGCPTTCGGTSDFHVVTCKMFTSIPRFRHVVGGTSLLAEVAGSVCRWRSGVIAQGAESDRLFYNVCKSYTRLRPQPGARPFRTTFIQSASCGNTLAVLNHWHTNCSCTSFVPEANKGRAP